MNNFCRFVFVVAVCFVFGVLPSTASAATNVYFSVGQNTNDHKTGTPTITISSGVATFSTAQTADNIGVGDKVTYNTSSVAFISGKASTTQWNVVTATGGTPPNVTGQTVNSITHAFACLACALVNGYGAGGINSASFLNTGDLVTGDYIVNVPIYNDAGSGDTTGNNIGGSSYVTGPNNYIKIYAPNSTTSEVNVTQRHSGKYDSTKAKVNVFFYGITSAINYLRLDGLQVNKIAINVASSTQAADVRVSNCIINGVDMDAASGSYPAGIAFIPDSGADSNQNRSARIYNNIIYGTVTGIDSSYREDNFAGQINFYNNTFYNLTAGISVSGAAYKAKNNLFASTSQPFGRDYFGNQAVFAAGTDYNSTASSSLDYSVTGGGNTHDRLSQTYTFLNLNTLDLHLTGSDTGALNHGVDLSGDSDFPFNIDLEGESRPQQSVWDIGADEYVQTTSIATMSTGAATSISTSTATFHGTIVATGGSNATESGFAYGTASNLATVIATSTLGGQTGTASFSQDITGLSQNTTYYFRTYSVNTEGTSYGSILSFTTNSVPVLTTLAATGVGTISVTGNATITATGGSTVTARGFQYGVSSATYGATSTASGLFLTGSYAGPITGLTCNTLYHVRAFGTNANGTGYGSDETFTTGACVSVSTFDLPRGEVFAPGWLALSDRIITQHPGNYIKFAVSNTSNITLTFDTSFATSSIYVIAVVDGATTTDTFIGVGSTTLNIATGLSAGRHEVFFEVKSLSNDNERWSGQTTMLQIQNIYLDSGGSILTPGGTNVVRPTRAVWYSDSLAEYLNSDPTVNDAGLTFPTRVSNRLNWEHEHRAFSAIGYINSYIAGRPPLYVPGGADNQPINAYDSTHSRLVDGKIVGDVMILAVGTNDINITTTSALESRVNNTIAYARGIFDGSIYVQLPFYVSDNYTNAIVSGFYDYRAATSSDTRVHLIDVGSTTRSTLAGQTIDSAHLSVTGQITASDALGPLYLAALDLPTAPLSPVAVGGVEQATITFATSSSNGGSPILTYTASSSPGTVVYATTTGPVRSITMTGLTPGNYNFRVKATNAVGESSYSALSNTVTVSAAVATTFTLTGPSSGGVGSPSSNFTVTPDGLYTGTVTITPTGSASTGLSATVLTFNNSADAQTFTITPTVAGSITLTPTNNGGLSNPSNLTYTVNAVAPGSPTSVTAATSTANQATVSFTAPASNGGSTILYYLASSTPGNVTAVSGSSPITLSGLTNGTSYTFVVYAVNAAGTSTVSSASNAVTPIGVPGAPTGATATGGNAQASITFTAPVSNGGNPVSGYTVTSSPSGGTDSNAGSTALTHVVTGLTNGTAYTFTVTATNYAGTGSASAASNSVTPSTIASVSTNSVTNIASTSATFSGSILSTGGSDATQSGFAYGTASNLSTVIATSTLGAQTGTATFTSGSTITNLTANTTYYVRAYATNQSGTNYGSIVSFLTLPAIPTLTTQAAVSGSGTRATINGTITATAVNATVRGVVYGLTTSYGATTTESGSFSTGTFSGIATGLACDTQYHVNVFATNTGGTGYGSDQTVITPACSKPTLTADSASSITATAATLFGTMTADGNASSTLIGFNWGTDTAYGSQIYTSGTYGIGLFSQNLSGLTCNTTYHFQAFATNDAGQGTSTVDQSFTTSVCPVSSGGGSSGGLGMINVNRPTNLPTINPTINPPIIKPVVPALVSNIPSFKTPLYVGIKSPSVKSLQVFLNAYGFTVSKTGGGSPGKETTLYGSLTKIALQKFQVAYKIAKPSDPGYGVLGPKTRAMINSLMKK